MTRNDAFFLVYLHTCTSNNILTIGPSELRAHLLQIIFAFVALETQSILTLIQINLAINLATHITVDELSLTLGHLRICEMVVVVRAWK